MIALMLSKSVLLAHRGGGLTCINDEFITG